MLRFSLRAFAAAVLCATASAQSLAQAMKVSSPIRDAGTYHVATGTWTHSGSKANLGPDIIYSATEPSGYFGPGWNNLEGIDEGILPSSSNPLGGQDGYVIDGFQFGYCTQDTSVDWSFNLYDSYVPCDSPAFPNYCINLAGAIAAITMPGSSTGGIACWLVTVDLAGGGEVCMEADGGTCAPGYQGAASSLDHFGWGATSVPAANIKTGPLLSGYDPNWMPEGEGTCYNTGQTCAAGVMGLGALDFFAINSPGHWGSCYWFGGYENTNGCGGPIQVPGAQFYFNLYTDCTVTCVPCGTVYCDTDVDQLGDIAISTCTVSGGPILSTNNATGGLFAYYNVSAGSNVINDPPGSQGQLCLGGSPIGRYSADLQVVSAGSFSTDLINGNTGGGAGNLPNPPGGQLAPGQTWNFQGWVRIAGSSRWTAAINVTFTN